MRDESSTKASSQNFFQFYFWYKGRVSLRQLWVYYFLPATILTVMIASAIFKFFRETKGLTFDNASYHFWSIIVFATLIIWPCLIVWSWSIMRIKRAHDLGMDTAFFGSFAISKNRKPYLLDSILMPSGAIMYWRILFEKGSSLPNQFGPASK